MPSGAIGKINDFLDLADSLCMNDLSKRRGDTYFCIDHFMRDVGALFGRRIEEYGIRADCALGEFNKKRLDELLKFCRSNPDLHIASFMPGGVIFNRASPDARWYFLGDGDANPRLVARDPEMLISIQKAVDHLLFAKK